MPVFKYGTVATRISETGFQIQPIASKPSPIGSSIVL